MDSFVFYIVIWVFFFFVYFEKILDILYEFKINLKLYFNNILNFL